jgi:MFS family permease
MIAAQCLMMVVSVVMTTLAFGHHLTPGLLLVMTFLLGCGSALYGPAWQASVGEQVPVRLLPASVALNSLGFNVARTLGPAIGGAIVAVAGAEAAFLVNALSYLALILALLTWRRTLLPLGLPPESIGAAIATGIRYVRLSDPIRTVLERAAVFGCGAGGLWATLPLVARDLLGGGAMTYGLLLGAFGAGAVLAALASTVLRRRYGFNRVATTASLTFAIGAAVAGLSPWWPLTMFAAALAGGSWVLSFSTFNVVVQVSSPRWVVGRTLALYQTAAFGGAAMGAWIWGVAAEQIGLSFSLLSSAGMLAVSAALCGRRRPLEARAAAELAPLPTADGMAQLKVPQAAGPIIITVEYRVAGADIPDFLRAAHELGRTRRRDGARRWSLMQDLDDPARFIERYQALTWLDHLRQWQRATLADQAIHDRVLGFHQGPHPPVVHHLWAREPEAAEPLMPAQRE